jgi:prepilin-type N-terminal cleavage/methylation domain-containing protein
MKKAAQGFTLVELLIVIALLGIIATIVIAAINPIEQANRAADAGSKADASQLISAINRYYVTHGQFPWMASSCTTNGGSFCNPSAGINAAFPFLTADDPSVGLCGAAGASCKTTATQGELISSLELQTQFLSKSWVGATTASSRLYVGKAAGSSAAIYTCWVPKANSNKQVLISSASTSNKLMNATTGFTSAGIPTAGTCTTVTDAGWNTAACAECVPE